MNHEFPVIFLNYENHENCTPQKFPLHGTQKDLLPEGKYPYGACIDVASQTMSFLYIHGVKGPLYT